MAIAALDRLVDRDRAIPSAILLAHAAEALLALRAFAPSDPDALANADDATFRTIKIDPLAALQLRHRSFELLRGLECDRLLEHWISLSAGHRPGMTLRHFGVVCKQRFERAIR